MNKFVKISVYIFFVLISGILLSGCTTSEEDLKAYNQLISEADLLIEGHEYNTALEKLSDASELLPSEIGAYERIVDIFITKNRLEDAIKILDESATKLKDSNRAILYTKIGDAYYNLEVYDKALYNYQLAKGFDVSYMSSLLGISKVYVQRGNIEGAKKLLDENYENEEYIESKLLLSYLYSLTSIDSAKEAINDVEPGETWRDKYNGWVEVLDSLTDDELFNSAKLAKLYIDEGYPYLAIALLEPQESDMAEYIDGIYMLGKAYYESGKYQESINLLEDNIFLSSLNQYIYWVLARDYYMLNNLESSFDYYETAISYGGDTADETLYKEYIDYLFEENMTEKGLEIIKRAEKIFDEEWVKIYYMNLYSLRDDTDKFEYYMDKVEYNNLDEGLKAEYLYIKGKYLIQNSELEEANRTIDTFWELNEYDPRYNFLVAKLSFQEGNLEDARTYSKRAIEYDTQRLVTDDAEKLLAQID